MKDAKDDQRCRSQTAGFLGVVFIVAATILTLFTLDGFGIFGMFLVGVMLLRKGCCSSSCGCGCASTSICDIPAMPKLSKLSKALKPKTTTKKAVKK